MSHFSKTYLFVMWLNMTIIEPARDFLNILRHCFQARLRKCADSPEHLLLAYTEYGLR